MKKIASFVSMALATAGIISGCAVEAGTPAQEDISAAPGAVCSNPDGTNAMLADLAAAIANELHRFEIVKDFEIYRGYNNQEMIRIKSTSRSLCSNSCRNIDALLAFQDSRNDQVFVFKDGTKLNSWTFASRLVAGYRAQANCDTRGVTDPNGCVAEPHYLEITDRRANLCDGVDYGLRMYTVKVSKATTAGVKISPETPLTNADRLQRRLLWSDADQTLPATGNPFLAFKLLSNNAYCELDPGDGGSEEPPPPATCGTSTLKYYPAPNPDITGTCCSVPGLSGNTVYRKYNLPSNPNNWTGYYKCQL